MQNIFLEIITNKLLVLPILVLLITQVLKFLPHILKGQFSFKIFWESGGMPSSHASTAISFATVSMIVFGLNSPMFALSVFLCGLIIRDALGVRKESSEHAKVLNKITEKKYKLNENVGHTVPEVLVGSVLGLVLTAVVLYFWK